MRSRVASLVRQLSSMFSNGFERLAVYWRQWLVRRLGDRTALRINAFLSAVALPSIALFLALAVLTYGSHRATRSAQTPAIVPTAPPLEQTAEPNISRTTLPQPEEIRGVWITNVASNVLFAPWGIPRAIDQLAALQFNTLYPVVWNRGNTFYRSSFLKDKTGQTIDPLVALMHPNKDPLEEIVELGHDKGMRVLPWFEYGFMVPLNSPLAQQHPDWLSRRLNGSRRLEDGTFEGDELPEVEAPTPRRGLIGQLLSSGAPRQIGWLNPMHPSVQGLLLSLVEEVIANYDIDGIQFDDHFSLPAEFGYDDYTVALYKTEHDGQRPPDDPADADWISWRAGKLSRFVSILYEKVKASCPTCTVSISPNPAKFAYRFHLQDWQTWVREGWVDELVVQIYRDDFEQFENELDKNPLRVAAEQIPVSVGILTGTWRHPIAFEQIKQQVESSRVRQFSGVCFFYWDTLWSYFTPEAPERRRKNFEQLMAVENSNDAF